MLTPLCDDFRIEYPIIQAPIGSATCPSLAAAVSDAGGLGHLAVTWRPPERTHEMVSETRERTDNPFAVNLVVDSDAQTHDPDAILDAALEAGAPILSFSFGDPDGWIERAHDAGAQVIVTVASAETASRAVELGADALCVQGWEAGGHLQSDVATTALVPQVSDAVDVPVVAAGGLGGGRGLVAALALGADGGWFGTRFLATEEANIADGYRNRVTAADETDTIRTELFDVGWPEQPHRVLRNSTVADWEGAGRPDSGNRPGEGETIAFSPSGTDIPRYSEDLPVDGTTGDLEAMAQYAGQSVGAVDDVQPAAQVVENIVATATATIDALRDLR